MKKFLKRLRRRRQLDRDLEDELHFHLEMKAEETGDAREAGERDFAEGSLPRNVGFCSA